MGLSAFKREEVGQYHFDIVATSLSGTCSEGEEYCLLHGEKQNKGIGEAA